MADAANLGQVILECHRVNEVAEGLAKPAHAPPVGFAVN